jgi:hypothetical protein
MNQQKGVQSAAEIAARGLIGKKKRPAQTGARQSPVEPAGAYCGGRSGGETPNTAGLAAGKKRYPIDYPREL